MLSSWIERKRRVKRKREGNFWEIQWRGKSNGLEFQGPGFSPQLSQNSLYVLRYITSALGILDFTAGPDSSSSSVLWLHLSLSINTPFHLKLYTYFLWKYQSPLYKKQSYFSFICWEKCWEIRRKRLRFLVNFYRDGPFKHVIMWQEEMRKLRLWEIA